MHFILHWWLNFFSIIDKLQFKSALRQSSQPLWHILGWWKSGNWGLWYFSICWFLILFIQVYRALYKTFYDNICWGSNWGDDNHSGSFSGQYDLRGRDDPLSTASTLNAFNNITSRRDDPLNFEWDTFIWRIHTVTSANTHRKMCDLRKWCSSLNSFKCFNCFLQCSWWLMAFGMANNIDGLVKLMNMATYLILLL